MIQAILITAYLVMLGVCIAGSVTDLKTHRIPNKLTGFAMLAALAFWMVAGLIDGRGVIGAGGGWPHGTLMGSLLGLLFGLVPFGILVTLGGLGGGDMKLMGAIGAWSASWQVVLGTTIYALIVAALIALVLMVWHKRVGVTLGRLVGIVATRDLGPDDPQAPKVPFAVAAAVGAALAGAEHLLGLWPPLLW